MVPPGMPDFVTRDAHRRRGSASTSRVGPGGAARRSRGSRSASTAVRTGPTRELDARPRGPWAWCGWSFDWEPPPASTSSAAARPTRPANPAARAGVEPRRLREQRRTARSRARALSSHVRPTPTWHHPVRCCGGRSHGLSSSRWPRPGSWRPRSRVRADGYRAGLGPRLPRAMCHRCWRVLAAIGLVGLAVQEREPRAALVALVRPRSPPSASPARSTWSGSSIRASCRSS